jgi:laccase
VNYTNVTRLNHTKSMMLVNGQFPGPPIRAHEGDTIVVRVTSFVKPNITIHWHGVRQLRTGWYDGMPYVTQCPLQQNASFTYRFQLLNQTGVLWYHAHTSWHRASIHGAIIVQPRKNVLYPFTTPSQEFTIILGEWWNADVEQVIADALATGGVYNTSDALTINGQPGFLYNSSAADAYRINITSGGLYLLRLVNACMNFILYVGVANHSLTVVQLDSTYAVPFDVDFVLIAPGQTLDVLLHANHSHGRYYLASSVFSIPSATRVPFPNVSATALVEYVGVGAASELHHNNNDDSTVTNNNNIMLPIFPAHNDSAYQQAFDAKLFSFNTTDQMCYIPQTVDIHLLFTVGYGLGSNTSCYPLAECEGFEGYRLLGSVNNITYKAPTPNKSTKSFLQYGYEYDRGHLTSSTSRSSFNLTFPDYPEHIFNYTGAQLPLSLWFPQNGPRLIPIRFNSSVELVLQDTSILQFEVHPFHLHGNSFYIVGSGSGNYDPATSPATFNLVNPPLRNTYGVPYGGWVAIRFRADNPGAWFFHCHFEIHQSWGMETVFFVQEGHGSDQRLPPPPADYPLC